MIPRFLSAFMLLALLVPFTTQAVAQDGYFMSAAPQAAEPEILLPGATRQGNLNEMWGDGPDAQYMDDPLKHPIFLALPPEMQDEVMAETEDYYNRCEKLPIYRTFHNCTCVSMKYFIQRLERGPDVPRIQIEDRIRLQCVDKARIAGEYYGRCLGMYKYSGAHDLHKRCECYANNMAQIYSSAPTDDVYGQIRQGVRAMGGCRDL